MTDNDLDLPNEDRVKKWGHRLYVGGDDSELWYGIGKRQYHFLVSQGLKSHHVFLDVACGSLRLGQFLIPMLNKGNYFGLEGERGLVESGINDELFFDIIAIKDPTFMINYNFDVSLCSGYDFAIAQSLFTHLNLFDIEKCFVSLAAIARPQSKFYFTFLEGNESENIYQVSHPNKRWRYQYSTLERIAINSGFRCDYIGDWGHERKQMIAVAGWKCGAGQ